MSRPMFIYSIGHSMCSSRIDVADRATVIPAFDINCFYTNVSHAAALAVHNRAEWLFYSDLEHRTITRLSLTGNKKQETLTVNTGLVKGLAVDWLSDNLYWTDETEGVIYVSRMDGRYPVRLIENLADPRGIAVDPVKG